MLTRFAAALSHWKGLRLIAFLSWLNAAVLMLIWGGGWYFSEVNNLAFLISEAPQVILLPYPLVLLILVLWRRNWPLSLLNGAIIIFVLFAFMGLHLPHLGRKPAGTSLRVMTFNVEKWSHGAPMVAQVLRSEHPDVICLQEAGDYPWVQPAHEPKRLESLLPGYQCVQHGEIIVASRLPILSAQPVPLLPGPSNRSALEVTVSVMDMPVTLVAVHLLPMQLDSHWHDPIQTWPGYVRQCRLHRHSQVNSLLSVLEAIKTPLVLCGDLNQSPASGECRRLAAVYPDAFDRAGTGFGYTETSTLPLRRIDHILTSPSLVPIRAFVPAVRASDHRPLIADLVFCRGVIVCFHAIAKESAAGHSCINICSGIMRLCVVF